MQTKKNPNLGSLKPLIQHQTFKSSPVSDTHSKYSKNSLQCNSPYENCLSTIKPIIVNEKDDFKTPKMVKQTSKQLARKTKKLKTKSNKIVRIDSIFKRTTDNFENLDVNAEHLQLALALSKSEQEENGCDETIPVFLTPEKIPKHGTTLERFGFRAKIKIPGSQDVKRIKCARFRFITPTLLTRSSEERQSLIDTKISHILKKNNSNLKTDTQTDRVTFFSRNLEGFYNRGRCVFKVNSLDLDELQNFCYYITDLNIPKSDSQCGCLLKCWENIPGRPVSPLPCYQSSHYQCVSPDLFDSDQSLSGKTLEFSKIFESDKGIEHYEGFSQESVFSIDVEDNRKNHQILSEVKLDTNHEIYLENQTSNSNNDIINISSDSEDSEADASSVTNKGVVDQSILNSQYNKTLLNYASSESIVINSDGNKCPDSYENDSKIKNFYSLSEDEDTSDIGKDTESINQELRSKYGSQDLKESVSTNERMKQPFDNYLEHSEIFSSCKISGSAKTWFEEIEGVKDSKRNSDGEFRKRSSLFLWCEPAFDCDSIPLNVTDYVNEMLNKEELMDVPSSRDPESDKIESSQSSSQESLVISDEEIKYSSFYDHDRKIEKMYSLSEGEDNSTGEQIEDLEKTNKELRRKYDKQDLNNCETVEQYINSTQVVPKEESCVSVTTTPQNKLIIKTQNITPMPDYDGMNTPQIHNELKKFSLKPLKRRRGVCLLKHIYDCTHPVVNSKEEYTQIMQNKDEPITKRRKSHKNVESCHDKEYIKRQDWDLEDLIFERKVSSKIIACKLPLQIAWHNFICNNPELQKNILLYEPLHLEVIHAMLKEQCGCKFHIEDLVRFLDKKCITFRSTKTSGGQGNRKRY